MKQRLTVTLFLSFLFVQICSAKVNRDSLWIVFSKVNEQDTNRLKAMHVLSWSFVFSDPDSAIHLADMQIDLAAKTGQPRYIANGKNTIGVAYMNLGNLDSSFAYHSSAYDLRRSINDQRGCSVSLNNLGAVMYQRGNYLQAIDYYQQSLTIKEQLKDMAGVATAYSNIALIYEDQKNWAKMKIYIDRSLAIRDSMKDDRGIADAYGHLGSYYMHMNDLVKSKVYISLAAQSYSKTTDVKGLANCISNLGLVFVKQHMPDSAMKYYAEAKAIREKAKDMEGVAYSEIEIGELQNQMGDPQHGVESCMRGLQVAEDIEFPELQLSACQCLSTGYEMLHQPVKALAYLRRADTLNDSLNDAVKMKAVTSLDLQYEFQKKQMRDSLEVVKQRAASDAEHKLEIDRQKFYTGLGAVGFLFMILIAFFLFRNSRIKQRNNILLENKNRIITEQMQELEHQKMLVEEKQEQILDSIHYAKRIQQSQLPTDKYIQSKLDRLND